MIMALLREDGSLDVERINRLPYEEYILEIHRLTKVQRKEYDSKLPINESHTPKRAIVVNSIDDELNSGKWVDARDFIDKMREKCNTKR